jgi:hypothetical protein
MFNIFGTTPIRKRFLAAVEAELEKEEKAFAEEKVRIEESHNAEVEKLYTELNEKLDALDNKLGADVESAAEVATKRIVSKFIN